MPTDNDRINNLCEAICILTNCIGNEIGRNNITRLQELINNAYVSYDEKEDDNVT